jgi:organic radical activating enzyme
MKSLKVTEIFYSLQGEGARAGSANFFIRLQGCKTKHACFAAGIKCDTEFESGTELSLDEIHRRLLSFGSHCDSIIWTGGEPADQLTEEVVQFFKDKGYYQAIETSGLKEVPKNIDWVSLSPKVAEHVLEKNFQWVNEVRYVRHKGQDIPQPSVDAEHYFVSPHSDGFEINSENLKHCIDLCLKNPKWKLSVQQHKIWRVL